MKPSLDKLNLIFEAWVTCQPPLKVAKVLRLSPLTVIAEYVRLDSINAQS